ncbi:MAG: hypothetical protein WC485_00190 [Opitutaceae bacterium]
MYAVVELWWLWMMMLLCGSIVWCVCATMVSIYSGWPGIGGPPMLLLFWLGATICTMAGFFGLAMIGLRFVVRFLAG